MARWTSEPHPNGALSGAAPRGERHPGLRAIGGAVSRVVAPVVARRNARTGALGRLKAEWRAIGGDELASVAWPTALGRDGALKLHVASGETALELQHRAPLAIERINGFFGRKVVARLVLVQGPLPLPLPSPSPAASRLRLAAPLSSQDRERLQARLADIADPELREALSGLGRLVIAASGRRGGAGADR